MYLILIFLVCSNDIKRKTMGNFISLQHTQYCINIMISDLKITV